MASVECDVSDFVRLLDGIQKDLGERTLPAAMRTVGARAVSIAQASHPYHDRSGDLSRSIALASGRDGSTYWTQIGTNKEYAPYVEFGTGQKGSATYVDRNGGVHTADVVFRPDWKGSKPYPFIRPAVYDNLDYYRSMIADALRKAGSP